LPRRRILLDECVDRRLADYIPDHDVTSVAERGWVGLSNGALLEKAQAEFDVFLTTDRNLSYQQNLSRFALAVAVLQAPTNRVDDLVPLIPTFLEALPTMPEREATIIRS